MINEKGTSPGLGRDDAGASAIMTYDNTTTFLGSGFAPGGVTSVSGVLTTNIVLVDLQMDPAMAGNAITTVKFVIANFDVAPVTARFRLQFFQADGTDGGPGTALGGVSYALASINAGVTLYTSDLSSLNLVEPTNNLWVGFFFDNNGASTTAAEQLNNLGLGLHGPRTVGTSQDQMFVSSTPSSFLNSNPPGTVYNSPFGGNPVANFGFQFNVVPEPAPFLVLGAALTALIGRRRR